MKTNLILKKVALFLLFLNCNFLGISQFTDFEVSTNSSDVVSINGVLNLSLNPCVNSKLQQNQIHEDWQLCMDMCEYYNDNGDSQDDCDEVCGEEPSNPVLTGTASSVTIFHASFGIDDPIADGTQVDNAVDISYTGSLANGDKNFTWIIKDEYSDIFDENYCIRVTVILFYSDGSSCIVTELQCFISG